MSDLANLQICVAELRHAPDGTWLYVLQMACDATRWQVVKRYSEIRQFWARLCELLMEGNLKCTERCHCLAGLEEDKFPKKHSVHTKAVLEARANELECFFQKLSMRLNLCNYMDLEKCALEGCELLRLVANFFEYGTQWMTSNPYKSLTRYQSMTVVKNETLHGKPSCEGRLSLSALQEVRLE